MSMNLIMSIKFVLYNLMKVIGTHEFSLWMICIIPQSVKFLHTCKTFIFSYILFIQQETISVHEAMCLHHQICINKQQIHLVDGITFRQWSEFVQIVWNSAALCLHHNQDNIIRNPIQLRVIMDDKHEWYIISKILKQNTCMCD